MYLVKYKYRGEDRCTFWRTKELADKALSSIMSYPHSISDVRVVELIEKPVSKVVETKVSKNKDTYYVVCKNQVHAKKDDLDSAVKFAKDFFKYEIGIALIMKKVAVVYQPKPELVVSYMEDTTDV